MNKTIQRQLERKTRNRNFNPDKGFRSANKISIDITNILADYGDGPFISRDELSGVAPSVVEQHQRLKRGEGDCRDGDTVMLGWQSLPDEITESHLDDVCAVADQLAGKIDVFISAGIGGSYLGIAATVNALTHTYYNQLTREQRGDRPEMYVLGQNTDPDYLRDTLDLLEDKRIGVHVISKSGTTAETAIAFRILRSLLEERLGDRAAEYIIATTDKAKGALRTLTEQKGYHSFVVPDDVGGRFSVLTDVGLFGLAVAGIDIHEFVAGFRHMKARTETDEFWENPALVHAAIRYLSWRKGKKIEVVATNATALYDVARWMEQLFPESEGHQGKGLWVSPSLYSEKLHANGQMVQEGERNILETFLRLEESDNTVTIPRDQENLDGLNYLPDAGHDLNFVNQLVIDGPAYAHARGGVPNMTVTVPRRNAFNLGQIYFLLERSVAVSGYLFGINPFIQPGVEAYKKAMFALAEKPGAEEQGKKMRAAMEQIKRTVI